MSDKQKKIGLFSLIMMIFSSIFGFANMPVAFLQMGYASIPWFIFAALLFFLPVSMMIAEYGAAFKDDHGGMYTWLKESIGEKWAFIGTFIWLSSWIVWLLSISSKVFIPFSALIFGKDMTQTWAFGPFNATQVVGILAILWMIFVTFAASHGAEVISKVSSVGGYFVTGMIFVFIIGSIVTLIAGHGHLSQELTTSSLFVSPNPAFQTPIATLSFVVYAIFAYAGMEALGGIIDSVKDPEKTFPKGMMISSLLIAAFPLFKKKQKNLPFEVFKHKGFTNLVVAISFLIVLFGIIFTCVEPFLQGDLVTGFWTVIGPIFFGSLAYGIYARAEKKQK